MGTSVPEIVLVLDRELTSLNDSLGPLLSPKFQWFITTFEIVICNSSAKVLLLSTYQPSDSLGPETRDNPNGLSQIRKRERKRNERKRPPARGKPKREKELWKGASHETRTNDQAQRPRSIS